MKKIFFGFIKVAVAIALILLVVTVLFLLISIMGAFIGVLVLLFFILTVPVLLYNALFKSK